MIRLPSVSVGVLLALAGPLHAAGLWAAWDLELGTHAPPTHFVLSVTSPTGTPVPGPMTIPWAGCTTLPAEQHCAPIGCPPTGTYEFVVQAAYAEEGLSAPSNIARCQATPQCTCTGTLVSTPPPPPAPPPTMPPRTIVPGPTVPPQLVLVPVGPLPTLPTVPPVPQSSGA